MHYDLGDPNSTAAEDPSFQLRLHVRLLFDDAPIPLTLAGVENIVLVRLLDLFLWKRRYLRLR
jgi:hypothetical protein